MNLIIFPASACPTSLFKHNKSIVVFLGSFCLSHDFCNLLYTLGLSAMHKWHSWIAWIIWDICAHEHLLLGNRKGLACGTKPTVCNYEQKQMLPSLNKHELMVQRSLINKKYISNSWCTHGWVKKELPVKQCILLLLHKDRFVYSQFAISSQF